MLARWLDTQTTNTIKLLLILLFYHYDPAPKAPGDGVWGMANPVLRSLSPQRGLDQGNNKLVFLVEDRRENVLAKEFFEIIEK